ncbi:MAG: DUF5618 family protein [Bacteroidales bacterium]|nr:DUF5618 family protein [Bacteroidales bacterium]
MKETTPIEESRRYVKNARKTLRENANLDVEQNRYRDEKYVKAAGNYLWGGVLIALDAVFHVKKDQHDRVDINDYRHAVGKRDKKLLGAVNDGYDVIHLYMTYDGGLSKKLCDSGFRIANEIIDKCAIMLGETPAPAA